MRILLETNAYSAMGRGHLRTAEIVRQSSEVLLFCFVIGELLFGFRCGSRFENNRQQLDDFLSRSRVSFIPASRVTADRFGRIASHLRRKGQPILTNDIWIAAHALETGADLVSFDRHFAAVDGLAWVNPDESRE